MNPARRSQLRDGLRADADRFTALAECHGTPLLVLPLAPDGTAAARGCPDSDCTTP